MAQAEQGLKAIWAGERRPLIALAVVYLALAALYTYVIPLRFGPDEIRHYNYVKRLVTKHALPALDAAGNELDGAIVFHPPGYYLLLSPIYAACHGLGDDVTLRLMRATSPLLVGAALAFFWLALARLYPDRRRLRLTAVAVFALLPHVQLESAVINNDVLAILMGALLFWQYARLNDRLPTLADSLWMGLTMTVFVNAKGQGVTVSPLWLLWLLCSFGRGSLRRREFWIALAAGYLPVLLLGSPWFIHNLRVYGQPLLIAGGSEPRNAHGQPYAAGGLLLEGLLLLPTFWGLVWRGVGGLFHSFWTQVGWFPAGAARLLYWAIGGLVALAAAGNARLGLAARQAGEWWWQAWPRAVRFGFLAYAMVWLNIMAIAVLKHIGWYQGGRYTLPVGYGVILFLALGWSALSDSERGRRLLCWLGVVWFGLLNLFCLYNLVFVLNPRYAPHWRPFG
ncbi:MAG: hypothetical protein HZB16_06855 [Armatimonadetes bacterium]|nr:hypothetical protein [Armatimonadota bacterium]